MEAWGGEQTVNGALAIADVLGIFGREGVYMAAHASYPALASPSYQAFRLYTNYDGRGGRFGDLSVYASGGDSDLLSTYASVDSTSKRLYLMVVNKDLTNDVYASLAITGLDDEAGSRGISLRPGQSQGHRVRDAGADPGRADSGSSRTRRHCWS